MPAETSEESTIKTAKYLTVCDIYGRFIYNVIGPRPPLEVIAKFKNTNDEYGRAYQQIICDRFQIAESDYDTNVFSDTFSMAAVKIPTLLFTNHESSLDENNFFILDSNQRIRGLIKSTNALDACNILNDITHPFSKIIYSNVQPSERNIIKYSLSIISVRDYRRVEYRLVIKEKLDLGFLPWINNKYKETNPIVELNPNDCVYCKAISETDLTSDLHIRAWVRDRARPLVRDRLVEQNIPDNIQVDIIKFDMPEAG